MRGPWNERVWELFVRLNEELEEFQGGKCGICGRGGDLIVDHDHKTGMVRGLLCVGCNNEEGRHGGDCEEWFYCPICLWRHAPATQRLGWTTTYYSDFGGFSDDINLGVAAPTKVLIEVERGLGAERR